MMGGLKSFLARKFLSGKNRNWLFSSLTFMAFAGVIISVMAFVVVQAVMSGFSEDLEKKILGFTAHLTVVLEPGSPDKWVEELSQEKGISQVQRFVEGEAVLSSPEGEMVGVRVRGLSQKQPPQGATLQFHFEEGEGWDQFYHPSDKLPGILIGAELATSLGIVPILAEKVELLFPLGDVGPTGEIEPNARFFRVLGTFRSGYYEYDSKYVMIPMEQAQWLFGDQGEEQVAIFLQRPSETGPWKDQLRNREGVSQVKTWQEQHTRLFHALKLERIGMIFVLTLMLLLSSFNILSLLMMVVFERRREIAVLRALGMGGADIGGIFRRAGLWIGLVGGAIGMVGGGGVALWLNRLHLPLPSTYYLEALPVKLHGGVLLGAWGVSVLLSYLATYFPGRESRSLPVTEALTYE
jgi:lipoprotein-releasing system permease protein